MKTKMRIAAVCVLAAVLLSGCQTIELTFLNPKADVKSIKFGDVTPEWATLLFEVEIENTYSFDLPVSNISFTLSSSEKPLFGGVATPQKTLPPKSLQTVSLPVKVGYQEVIDSFKDYIVGMEIPYEAEVNLYFGTPSLDKIHLPLKKTGQISVPNTSRFWQHEIDWRGVLLDEPGR
jgi:LEA14-like dessication related protein